MDFSPLRLQYPQEPPEFPSICPPSIAEFPLFNQLGLPNLTRNRSVVCISNWSPFYPPFQLPSLPFLLLLRMSLDFSCGRTLRERLRSTRPAALISALTLNGNVASTIGKLRAISNSVGRTGDWSGLSPGNPAAHPSVKKYLVSISEEQAKARVSPRQAVPFFFDKFTKLSPTYVTECSFHPYPRWKGTS